MEDSEWFFKSPFLLPFVIHLRRQVERIIGEAKHRIPNLLSRKGAIPTVIEKEARC